jgi:hypothetical protein
MNYQELAQQITTIQNTILLGFGLAFAIVAYREGVIQEVVDKYKTIDNKIEGRITSILLIITLPLVFVCLNTLINSSSNLNNIPNLTTSTDDIKTNPFSSLPFDALATGFGIVIGNLVINYIKAKDESYKHKKTTYLCIQNQYLNLSIVKGYLTNSISEYIHELKRQDKVAQEAHTVYSILIEAKKVIQDIQNDETYKLALNKLSILDSEKFTKINAHFRNQMLALYMLNSLINTIDNLEKGLETVDTERLIESNLDALETVNAAISSSLECLIMLGDNEQNLNEWKKRKVQYEETTSALSD